MDITDKDRMQFSVNGIMLVHVRPARSTVYLGRIS